jgi:predicted DNA-binding transcriptional regulator YafY
MDGYKMERTLLTSADMQAILTGLRSLDSICGTKRYQQLMNKLSVEESSVLASNSHIRIDLASWYKSQLAPKITCIQEAIDQQQKIAFTYYAPKGESMRVIEPYLLIFQWASWYIWGYCTLRQDYRMFKLNRMQELHMTSETFELREHPAFELDHREIFPQNFEAEAVFLPEMKWRLVEEYGLESFTEQKDGTLLFRAGFMDQASLFGWLLTFGDKVELQKPLEYREEFAAMVERTLSLYNK